MRGEILIRLEVESEAELAELRDKLAADTPGLLVASSARETQPYIVTVVDKTTGAIEEREVEAQSEEEAREDAASGAQEVAAHVRPERP